MPNTRCVSQTRLAPTQAASASRPEAPSLAICTTEMYLYVYGENVFVQYIFADAYQSPPWPFSFLSLYYDLLFFLFFLHHAEAGREANDVA